MQVADLKEENIGRLIMFFQLWVIAMGEALQLLEGSGVAPDQGNGASVRTPRFGWPEGGFAR